LRASSSLFRQAPHLRGDEFVALRQAAHLRGDELDAPLLAGALARLAEIVAPIDEDRTLSPDIERVVELLRAGEV